MDTANKLVSQVSTRVLGVLNLFGLTKPFLGLRIMLIFQIQSTLDNPTPCGGSEKLSDLKFVGLSKTKTFEDFYGNGIPRSKSVRVVLYIQFFFVIHLLSQQIIVEI